MKKHDEHYKSLSPHETWDVIETWVKANECFFREHVEAVFLYGNVLKYLSRFSLKSENPLDDLEKASNYLTRLIENIKEAKEKGGVFGFGLDHIALDNCKYDDY